MHLVPPQSTTVSLRSPAIGHVPAPAADLLSGESPVRPMLTGGTRTTRRGERATKPLSALTTGEIVHRTLATCLPSPSEQLVCSAAFAQCALDSRSPALRNRVTILALRYVRSFHPAHPARLLAVELAAGPTRFDLVWEDDSGVWVDEIKTAGVARLAQLRRQVAAGDLRWGDRFVGVRLVALHRPADSVLVRLRHR
jgi:hypothetical protein